MFTIHTICSIMKEKDSLTVLACLLAAPVVAEVLEALSVSLVEKGA